MSQNSCSSTVHMKGPNVLARPRGQHVAWAGCSAKRQVQMFHIGGLKNLAM